MHKPINIIFYTTGGYTCPSGRYAEVFPESVSPFGTTKIGEVSFATGGFFTAQATDIEEQTEVGMGREPILIDEGQTIIGDMIAVIKEYNKP